MAIRPPAAGSGAPLRARLVLHHNNRGWIIEKFAVRLVENLTQWGVIADISDVPFQAADINHWMHYLQCKGSRIRHGTMLITHVDQLTKLGNVREGLEVVNVGICLSRMTVRDLVGRGIPEEQLCYITPGHDQVLAPRRIVIGITSRLHNDGRKREELLKHLAKAVRLDAFHFEIIGQAWEKILPHLEASGATVRYFPGTDDYEQDYRVTLERMPTFDFYLYTGLDEGSMGFLDALAAGVQTIVTPQGFHLDVPGGISHPFTDASDLCAIFDRLAAEHARRASLVRRLTWSEYARQHAIVWRAILEGWTGPLDVRLHGEQQDAALPTSQSLWSLVLGDWRYYRRGGMRRLRRLFRRQ